ncbi:MAG TPA: aminoglycoside 6-adenylyltransferase [Gaiellaceae bacterium]|nr:aminoglycoside 6-adenylyltransferase [Gaiellaceae bacterium]
MADRLSATGILLVGGGSERFGSPKALARFRGQTLAERAWRLLGEVCDEVLAVGKEADGLALPFPVLDDGASGRAPVHGLLAGLRAARHETCLALPVDLPLVTADALRTLLAERAVPQTGPLPGVYERALLPELERRVAAGELTLRGLVPRVVELDEHLLANVNTRIDLLEAALADWAAEQEDVRAAVVVGSRARADTPADRWSDLDVLLVVDDPRRYSDDPSWVEELGRPLFTFLEPTLAGQVERRVLFETGEDLDLPLLPASALAQLEADPEIAHVLARGYRVLVDEIGLADRLARMARSAPEPSLPAQRDLDQLGADFWYHALWTARKLRRGEVFVAVECLDAYLKARLVTLLAWHARALDPGTDTWFGGRFLERWADPGALAALAGTYARYDLRDAARALWAAIDLWQALEEETARRLGLATSVDHADLRRRIAEVLPDPRGRSTLSP